MKGDKGTKKLTKELCAWNQVLGEKGMMSPDLGKKEGVLGP